MELAVAGKLVKIVEYLAQLRTKLHMKQAISLDSALYNIISYDTCIGEIRKRELHQEVYQIVDILLAQGANPDAFEHMGSARDLASTHPDPRVKNRFLHAARPKQHSKELSSQVGRSWVTPSQALPTRTPKRAKRLRQAPRVNLWDYVKSHNGQEQSGNQESDVAAVLESNDNGTGGGQVTSVSTSASTNAVDASGDHAGLQPDLPSPLASSSPHDGSKVPEVLPPKRVWGEVRSATTPATAQAKTSQDDEFPVLLWKYQTDTADMNSSSKASTSLKGKADAEASDTKQTQKSGKSLKGKKKWEKLVLS
ncbi:hypothetical protein ACET3X_000348 [Alternaria dauci]|uniref:Ankyrin repeat protein n=1 Tax=Alternaria dauci TaxID=48095 RepID=A0ABR3UU54_9PLEO